MSKKTEKYNKMGYYFDDEFDYDKLYEKNKSVSEDDLNNGSDNLEDEDYYQPVSSNNPHILDGSMFHVFLKAMVCGAIIAMIVLICYELWSNQTIREYIIQFINDNFR